MDVDALVKTNRGQKGGKGKDKELKGASSLDEWTDGQEEQPSVRNLVGAVDRRDKYNRRERYNRREKYDRRDWQAWEQIQKQARQQWESYKARCEFC